MVIGKDPRVKKEGNDVMNLQPLINRTFGGLAVDYSSSPSWNGWLTCLLNINIYIYFYKQKFGLTD